MEERFYEGKDPKSSESALSTYFTRPEVIRVTKTQWNRDQIVEIGGIPPLVIGPSVDVARFYPRSDDRLQPGWIPIVSAMVRPESKRRGPEKTLRLLRKLKEVFGYRVVVECFGGNLRDIVALGVPLSGITVRGILTPDEVAELLGRTDVFLDLSEWQAMGLTTLEAMASGAAVVAPLNGGTKEFCVNGKSGLLVDTLDEEACYKAAFDLVTDPALRLEIGKNAMEVATNLGPERAARRFLDCFWGDSS